MEIWQFILVLVLASMVSSVISGLLSTLFHRKWSICDINMMSYLYVTIIFDFIIGCPLMGWVFWIDNSSMDWRSKAVSALIGIVSYAIAILFSDVRKYNKLRDSLEILTIDSNEKLEQFIKEQEQK